MLILSSTLDNLNGHFIADELAASERLTQLLNKPFLLWFGIIGSFIDHMPEVVTHGESRKSELSLNELSIGTFTDTWSTK